MNMPLAKSVRKSDYLILPGEKGVGGDLCAWLADENDEPLPVYTKEVDPLPSSERGLRPPRGTLDDPKEVVGYIPMHEGQIFKIYWMDRRHPKTGVHCEMYIEGKLVVPIANVSVPGENAEAPIVSEIRKGEAFIFSRRSFAGKLSTEDMKDSEMNTITLDFRRCDVTRRRPYDEETGRDPPLPELSKRLLHSEKPLNKRYRNTIGEHGIKTITLLDINADSDRENTSDNGEEEGDSFKCPMIDSGEKIAWRTCTLRFGTLAFIEHKWEFKITEETLAEPARPPSIGTPSRPIQETYRQKLSPDTVESALQIAMGGTSDSHETQSVQLSAPPEDPMKSYSSSESSDEDDVSLYVDSERSSSEEPNTEERGLGVSRGRPRRLRIRRSAPPRAPPTPKPETSRRTLKGHASSSFNNSSNPNLVSPESGKPPSKVIGAEELQASSKRPSMCASPEAPSQTPWKGKRRADAGETFIDLTRKRSKLATARKRFSAASASATKVLEPPRATFTASSLPGPSASAALRTPLMSPSSSIASDRLAAAIKLAVETLSGRLHVSAQGIAEAKAFVKRVFDRHVADDDMCYDVALTIAQDQQMGHPECREWASRALCTAVPGADDTWPESPDLACRVAHRILARRPSVQGEIIQRAQEWMTRVLVHNEGGDELGDREMHKVLENEPAAFDAEVSRLAEERLSASFAAF